MLIFEANYICDFELSDSDMLRGSGYDRLNDNDSKSAGGPCAFSWRGSFADFDIRITRYL